MGAGIQLSLQSLPLKPPSLEQKHTVSPPDWWRGTDRLKFDFGGSIFSSHL